MEEIRIHRTFEKDGEVVVSGLPCGKSQSVELAVLIKDTESSSRSDKTPKPLRQSDLVGLP